MCRDQRTEDAIADFVQMVPVSWTVNDIGGCSRAQRRRSVKKRDALTAGDVSGKIPNERVISLDFGGRRRQDGVDADAIADGVARMAVDRQRCGNIDESDR